MLVIPAYDPPRSLADYVSSLIYAGFDKIIIVNDGSGTECLPVFMKLARIGCRIVTHEERQGMGAALKTGFLCYQENYSGKTDGVITLNADCQLAVREVEKVASSLSNEQKMGSFALVVGTRSFDGPEVTSYDEKMNKATKTIYRILFGLSLQDPVSSTLGIPDVRVPECIAVAVNGYGYDSSLLIALEDAGILQVPVKYPKRDPDAEQHFRKGKDTFLILLSIFKKFIMYSVTSLMATFVDLLLFGIFTSVTFAGNPMAIIYSTILARVVSGSVNYILTKHFVFRYQSRAKEQARSAGQFVVLQAAQCLASAFSVHILDLLLNGNVVGLKVLVDAILFFVSYKVQHKYIFKDSKKEK